MDRVSFPSTSLPGVTFSFAACLVFSSIQSSWSRDTSKAARISLIISSAWGGEGMKAPHNALVGTGWTGYNLPRTGSFPAFQPWGLGGIRIPRDDNGEGMGTEVFSQWLCCPGQRWL